MKACVFILPCLLVGCANQIDTTRPSSNEPFDEGTRVVAHALYFEETSPLLLSPHDLKTNEDCVFQKVDGKTLCVSPSQTVSAPTAKEAPRSAEGSVTVLEDVTDDGGRFVTSSGSFVSAFDNHRQLPCEVHVSASPGDGPCIPPYAIVEGFFGDANCSVPVAETSSDVPPVIVQRGLDFFEVGSPFNQPVYSGSPGSCGLFTPNPDGSQFHHFTVGPALADPKLANVHISFTGSGRLRIATLESDGKAVAYGQVGVERVYFDQDLDKTCSPVRTSTGIRCYTGALVDVGDAFSDPACSLPVIRDYPSDVDSVAVQTAPYGPTDGIESATVLYRVDNEVATKVFSKASGQCLEVTAPMKGVFYAVTGPDDWSRFAKLEERIGSKTVSN